VRPALELELGRLNLTNFVETGYEHIHITPDADVMRKMNKIGFIDKGFPYYGWLTAIMTAVIRVAINFKIPLIFYGEDGEVEYGGSIESKYNPIYDIHYMKRVYLEGGYEKILSQCGSPAELFLFSFPSDDELKSADLSFTHWSYYEAWDSYRNYLIAKEYCGLSEQESPNAGTFTNFAQNDQALYALHAYIMYLKFGFGRATQDAGIEIRRGAMTRDQAVSLVSLYDNQYPEEFIETYLNYYQMSKEEFDLVLDKWVNPNLFEKINGRWMPKFNAGEDFEWQ
jgi:N-acetyl sugar amidotransferase